MLTSLGYRSKIYAGHVAPELASKIKPYFLLKPKEDDIILIHHAIGHDLDKWLINLPGKKVLIYHNITPAKFFPKDSPVQTDIKKGHQQLKGFLAAGIQDAITVSDYNKIDLEKIGYKNIVTLPLLIDLNLVKMQPWNKTLVATESKIPTIIFVGRVVQNKCQHQLLEVANYLRAFLNTPFQMVIIGNYNEEEPYYQALQQKIQEYQLADWVQFTGKIPNKDLYGWYRAADCFLCLSEHEGFGVPILEAMAFDTPVLGFDATNVPYLLKNAGIIINEKKTPAIAALVKTLLGDESLRKQIIASQKKKLAEFNTESLLLNLKAFIDKIKPL